MKSDEKKVYAKPILVRIDNIKNVTRDCPDFSCSIDVPPPPPAP